MSVYAAFQLLPLLPVGMITHRLGHLSANPVGCGHSVREHPNKMACLWIGLLLDLTVSTAINRLDPSATEPPERRAFCVAHTG